MTIVLRSQKGSPLTSNEVDGNFTDLDGRTTTAQQRADAAHTLATTAKSVADAAQPKEAGKGLSTNDYDATEKAKVAAAIPTTQKGVANGVATLGADGKLPVSQLPPLAVNEVFTVANQAAMLALTAERGDAAIRTDQNGQWYVLTTDVPSVLGNWKPINQNLGVALMALGAVTPAADTIAYFSGTATAATTAFTTKARALLGRTDTAGMQAELALVPVTGSTDTTAGRLMTVGYKGLGAASIPYEGAAKNPDTYLIGGNYWGEFAMAEWGGAGQPTVNVTGYLTVIPGGDSSLYATQVFTNGANGFTFVRARNGSSAWSRWAKQFNILNAETDPQTALGLMSTTIVSGWTITKYLNGDMFATSSVGNTPSIPVNTVQACSFTIPSGFIGDIYPNVQVQPGGNVDCYGVVYSYFSSATVIVAGVRNGATVAQAFLTKITLKGRWKT